MGMVHITIRGSFRLSKDEMFSAMDGGHALALSRAIEFLASQMPDAIVLDHKLHSEGQEPPRSGFGCKIPVL